MESYINISEIPNISLLIKDYLTDKKSVLPYYGKTLTFQNLIKQSQEKLSSYKYRNELINEITFQLSNLQLTENQKNNLEKLATKNTVTITTGHQLNLMSGPLYFIYKILHTIKLCESMNSQQNEINFIPIFWMATEDHDFKEINHFNFEKNSIEWDEEHKDYVGNIATKNLKNILNDFYENLKYYPKGSELRKIIEKSYFKENNLADATRVLVHELFKEYGLLILDGNSKNLKKLLIPYIEDDIKEQKSFQKVNETIQHLKLSKYKIQVNPRKINFFYHNNNERNRIDETNGKYYILGTCKNFSQEEILDEIQKHPEKFSPNALLRPVYQELILPNVAYIGGNAEIAYWLELKSYFISQNLPFPILIPRNSFLLINENKLNKLNKFQINFENLFDCKELIIKSLVKKNSSISFNFKKYENRLNKIFEDLLEESKSTDTSWKNMILAQQKKQLNGLDKINKRFHKAEKNKHSQLISNFENFYDELFPENNWQERVVNFSNYYVIFGKDFIDLLYQNTKEFRSVINLTIV